MNVVHRTALAVAAVVALSPAACPGAGYVGAVAVQGDYAYVGINRNVVVVDDVVTTGATLLAASDALVQQGARVVTLAAVASTPAAVGAKVLPFRHAPRAVAA